MSWNRPQKNVGRNLNVDVVLRRSRGSPSQWFPETEYLCASAIFVVGTSGIPPNLNYRSVSPIIYLSIYLIMTNSYVPLSNSERMEQVDSYEFCCYTSPLQRTIEREWQVEHFWLAELALWDEISERTLVNFNTKTVTIEVRICKGMCKNSPAGSNSPEKE